MVGPVNTDKDLVTESRRDKQHLVERKCCINIGMPGVDLKWQPHYQARVHQANYLSIPKLKKFSKCLLGKNDWPCLLLTNHCTRKQIRIGQYNVRTSYQKGRLAQLNTEMKKYRLEILGVSKVRWNGSG
jgi:hypothetical protein